MEKKEGDLGIGSHDRIKGREACRTFWLRPESNFEVSRAPNTYLCGFSVLPTFASCDTDAV